MTSFEVSFARLVSFRCQVCASFTFRADALSELLQSLPLVGPITAVVQVCLALGFRRSFASIYDGLRHGRICRTALRTILAAAEGALGAVCVAGYAVYAMDGTVSARPDAATLPDRLKVYSAEKRQPVAGHQFLWLGRVIAWGQSWFAPLEMDRIPTDLTPAEVAVMQIQHLAERATPAAPKVVTVDSGFNWPTFLLAFAGLTSVFLLLRIANNRVLFGAPPAKHHGNQKHGRKLSLHAPTAPDRHLQATILGQTVVLSAWLDYHFQTTAALSGMVVRVRFLKADGTPRYKLPLWLYWTGPQDVALEDLAQMYLMRFTIEHFFRFLKQRLGLLAARTTDLVAETNWIWIVFLTYWQLLLSRDLVQRQPHPWDPASRRDPAKPLTPGQVLDSWVTFSGLLGILGESPKPAGKAPGRQAGFCPKPRPRWPVVRKTQEKAPSAA
jgi:hypothetical protein